MANSLVGGLIANHYEAERICACDIDAAQLQRLRESYGIRTDADSQAQIRSAS